jgi:hypothetical protein
MPAVSSIAVLLSLLLRLVVRLLLGFMFNLGPPFSLRQRQTEQGLAELAHVRRIPSYATHAEATLSA